MVLVAGALLVGCDSGAAQLPELGVYVSGSIDIDGQRSQLFDDVEVTVEVSRVGDERWVSWRAGCNTGTAPAQLDDGRLELTDVVRSTAMDCGPEKNEQDDRLEEFFEGEPGWEHDGEVLRLRSEDGTSEMVLDRQPADSEE